MKNLLNKVFLNKIFKVMDPYNVGNGSGPIGDKLQYLEMEIKEKLLNHGFHRPLLDLTKPYYEKLPNAYKPLTYRRIIVQQRIHRIPLEYF